MIEPGRVVRSKSGHDKDRFYVVVAAEKACVWIADGKVRKLSKPKRKNPRHLAPANTMLDIGAVTSDKKLRTFLRPFNGGSGGDTGMEGD